MQTAPEQEHRWLDQLVGDWTSEGQATMEPGKPPETFKGTERVRSLGGLWILGEGQGEMPGGTQATTLLTLGYDPQRKRFVGTWIGSMMTHLWVYDGALDATGRVLTLETEGPGMTDQSRMARYRDVIEVLSEDHRVLTSHALGDDGTWRAFMRADYRRKR
jgi:Protein of unknown function (DUF1579)